MKKIKIIVPIFIFLIFSFTVFASYFFSKNVTNNVEIGKIDLISQSFLYYDGTASEPQILDINSTNDEYGLSNRVINCYATEKLGYSDEKSYFELNNLGFQFTFSTNIDVYMRIHIEDAWISHKVYNNGSIVEQYITKGTTEQGQSPFINELSDWKFDEDTGYLYYKTKVEDSNENQSFNFKVSDDYFYIPKKSTAFRESILVQVSFTVDIIQANRAEVKWGISNIDDFLGK